MGVPLKMYFPENSQFRKERAPAPWKLEVRNITLRKLLLPSNAYQNTA
jgi:hypothetical protein